MQENTSKDDIFMQSRKRVDFSQLPSVEEMPVLPAMRQIMDVDLAVNEKGYVMLFHDSLDIAQAEYIIYDIDDAQLYLVDYSGRVQDIGMPVHEPMRPHLEKVGTIHLIHMHEGSPQNFNSLCLVSMHYQY